MSSISRTFSIDPRPEMYRPFFDIYWASDFLRTAENSKLQEPAFDLVRNWEATSNGRSVPWLMVECLNVSERTTLEDFEPLDRRKIRILSNKLLSRLEQKGERIRPMLRKRLQESITELDAETEDIVVRSKEHVNQDRPDLWQSLLKEKDFTTSLWGLERICYSAVYYNYEWFLTECIRKKRSNPEYRLQRHDDFKTDFRDDFGSTLQQECWSHQQIVIARYARHALLHNAGRLTKDLEKQPHTFPVNDGEIQVGPVHTNELYDLLKAKALRLAEHAKEMPELQRN